MSSARAARAAALAEKRARLEEMKAKRLAAKESGRGGSGGRKEEEDLGGYIDGLIGRKEEEERVRVEKERKRLEVEERVREENAKEEEGKVKEIKDTESKPPPPPPTGVETRAEESGLPRAPAVTTVKVETYEKQCQTDEAGTGCQTEEGEEGEEGGEDEVMVEVEDAVWWW